MRISLVDIILQWIFSPKPKYKVGQDLILSKDLLWFKDTKQPIATVKEIKIKYTWFSYTIIYSIEFVSESKHLSIPQALVHMDVYEEFLELTKKDKRHKRLDELLN